MASLNILILILITSVTAVVVLVLHFIYYKKAKEQKRQITSMVSNLPGFVYKCKHDKDWTMIYLSGRCVEITGYEPSEFIDNSFITFNEIIKEEYREKLYQSWQSSIMSKTMFEEEYEIVTRSGELKWVLERGAPVLDDRNEVLFLEGYIEDVSETVQHRKIQQQLYESMLLAKEKAEQSEKLKMAFLANMSHEIRTPMNGILGFMELLKEPGLAEESRQEYIELVNISGQRLLTTINDIIEISKIESGEREVKIEQVNIESVMQFYYDFFKRETDSKGIYLKIGGQIAGDQAIILTDKHKIDSILTNLIKNAIKFTYQGGIEFGNYIEQQMLIFYVKDSGRGIASERQEAIFERFIQADTHFSRSYEGSGLGLAIAKAYVDALGGTIRVESEPYKGSIFRFSIPYLPFFNGVNKMDSIDDGSKTYTHGIKVIVAEDDEISYRYIEKIIQADASLIMHATTGVETIRMARENEDIALILMDLKMPDMDGLEATRRIRRFNTKVPIIAQTAYALPGDKEKAKEAGCNDYLSKPVSKNDLVAMISRYCS